MQLVETKTYKVDIADAERENFRNMADKLEQIEHLFAGKQIFYKAEDECDYEMTSKQMGEMVEFLRALAWDDIEVL